MSGEPVTTSRGGGIEWFDRWYLTVGAALCAAASFAIQIWAGEDLPNWGKIALVVVGGVAAASALVLPIFQAEKALQGEADARAVAERAVQAQSLTMHDVLLPATELFDRIVTAEDESRRLHAEGAAKHAILGYAVTLAGVPRARSCYYEYQVRSKGQRRLNRAGYVGRQDKPRDAFRSNAVQHRRIFELLDERRPDFQPDVRGDRPASVPDNRHYSTYVSAPVATSTTIFGLLTLDALTAGDLTYKNESDLLLLAQLLALMLAACRSPAPRPPPVEVNQKWAELEHDRPATARQPAAPP